MLLDSDRCRRGNGLALDPARPIPARVKLTADPSFPLTKTGNRLPAINGVSLGPPAGADRSVSIDQVFHFSLLR
jgi:hypothetical protein